MARMINWEDKHCPNGHTWVFCQSSNLYPDFYYCPKEDLMWEPTTRPVDEAEVQEQYNTERPAVMREYAKRELALERIGRESFKTIIAIAAQLEAKKPK